MTTAQRNSTTGGFKFAEYGDSNGSGSARSEPAGSTSNVLVPLTASRVTVEDDNGRTFTYSGAGAITITVSAGMSSGFGFTVIQLGIGSVSVAGAAGVTVANISNLTSTAGVSAVISIMQSGKNTYSLIGQAAAGLFMSNAADILGDSINSMGYQAQGATLTGGETSLAVLGTVNRLERGEGKPGFDVVGFFAVGGTTAQQCLSTQVPQSIASPAKIAVVHVGVNSYNDTITGGGATYSQANNIAAVISIIDALLAAGKYVIVESINPVSQAGATGAKPRATEFPAHNAAIQAYCTLVGAKFIDQYSVLVDPASGVLNPLPDLIQATDGIHFTSKGSRAVGDAKRNDYVAGITLVKYKTVGSNLLAAFTGNGGTKTPGAGTISGVNPPLGYNIQIASGTSTVTLSNPDANTLRLTISNPGGTASSVYCQITGGAGLNASLADGDVAQAGYTVAVTSAVNLTRIAANITFVTVGSYQFNSMARDTNNEVAGVFKYSQADQSGKLLTPPFNVPSGRSSMGFIMACNVDPVGSVVVDISSPVFYKLT